MNITTLIGLASASIIILIAILMGGAAGMFFNIPSILIVVGGTLSVVFVKFTLPEAKSSFSAFKKSIKKPEGITEHEELIDIIMELSDLTRKQGILVSSQTEIDHPFLKLGIKANADGLRGRDLIKALQDNRKQQSVELKKGAAVWEFIGDMAPAFGMIGTLVGLIQMLANMSDPSSIGPAMAVAMLTTLYGAMFANLVAIPISEKIKTHNEKQDTLNEIVIKGLYLIDENYSKGAIEDVLRGYKVEPLKIPG